MDKSGGNARVGNDEIGLLAEELQLSVKGSMVVPSEKPNLICIIWTEKLYNQDSFKAQTRKFEFQTVISTSRKNSNSAYFFSILAENRDVFTKSVFKKSKDSMLVYRKESTGYREGQNAQRMIEYEWDTANEVKWGWSGGR
ncbi:hypothetical protein PVK06_038297 [Gossypium arboreum]|uniref:Uncharacterized protein n=1 Tax=Gossypium arboreum TaxID=29729 RepID=A0ABR0N065_GOSAR|nr:hypothetical protein PVK06_038297 [Gossypium arboreum]